MHPAGPCPSAFVWYQIPQCLEATIAVTHGFSQLLCQPLSWGSLSPTPQEPQHPALVIQHPKEQQQLWALGNPQAAHCSPSPIFFAKGSVTEGLTGHWEGCCGWLFPNEKPMGRQILTNWGKKCLTLVWWLLSGTNHTLPHVAYNCYHVWK